MNGAYPVQFIYKIKFSSFLYLLPIILLLILSCLLIISPHNLACHVPSLHIDFTYVPSTYFPYSPYPSPHVPFLHVTSNGDHLPVPSPHLPLLHMFFSSCFFSSLTDPVQPGLFYSHLFYSSIHPVGPIPSSFCLPPKSLAHCSNEDQKNALSKVFLFFLCLVHLITLAKNPLYG